MNLISLASENFCIWVRSFYKVDVFSQLVGEYWLEALLPTLHSLQTSVTFVLSHCLLFSLRHTFVCGLQLVLLMAWAPLRKSVCVCALVGILAFECIVLSSWVGLEKCHGWLGVMCCCRIFALLRYGLLWAVVLDVFSALSLSCHGVGHGINIYMVIHCWV